MPTFLFYRGYVRAFVKGGLSNVTFDHEVNASEFCPA